VPPPWSVLVSARTAIVVVAILAVYTVSLTYYVSYYDAHNAPKNVVNVYVYIYGPINPGGSAFYLPDNFTVVVGQNVSLVVYNDDGVTHGLAIPKFAVDTGAIPSDSRKAVSFIPKETGTYEFEEPTGECALAGGTCDSMGNLVGNMTVVAKATGGVSNG